MMYAFFMHVGYTLGEIKQYQIFSFLSPQLLESQWDCTLCGGQVCKGKSYTIVKTPLKIRWEAITLESTAISQ